MKENADSADYNMIRVCLMDIEVRNIYSLALSHALTFRSFQMPVMDGLTAIRELRRREKEGELEHHYVRSRSLRPADSVSAWAFMLIFALDTAACVCRDRQCARRAED